MTKISKTDSSAFYQKSYANICHAHLFTKKREVYKVPKALRNNLTYSKLRHHVIALGKQTYAMTD